MQCDCTGSIGYSETNYCLTCDYGTFVATFSDDLTEIIVSFGDDVELIGYSGPDKSVAS